jgi:hypothetical protein
MEIQLEIEYPDKAVAAFLLGRIAQAVVDLKLAEAPTETDGPRAREGGLLALAIALVGGAASAAQLVCSIYEITVKRRALTKIHIKGRGTITIDPDKETLEEVLEKLKRELPDK